MFLYIVWGDQHTSAGAVLPLGDIDCHLQGGRHTLVAQKQLGCHSPCMPAWVTNILLKHVQSLMRCLGLLFKTFRCSLVFLSQTPWFYSFWNICNWLINIYSRYMVRLFNIYCKYTIMSVTVQIMSMSVPLMATFDAVTMKIRTVDGLQQEVRECWSKRGDAGS